MKENLINILAEEKILPIIRTGDPQKVIDTAKALKDGGIKVVEVLWKKRFPQLYYRLIKSSKKY